MMSVDPKFIEFTTEVSGENVMKYVCSSIARAPQAPAACHQAKVVQPAMEVSLNLFVQVFISINSSFSIFSYTR